MRTLIIVSALSFNAFAASPLIFGVRGGAPITNNNPVDTFSNSLGALSPTHRFEVGPTLGVRLPLGFSIEGDALYNRQSLDTGAQVLGLNQFSTSSSSWDFPVLLKFTAGHHAIAPVFGAGMTVRHLNNFGDIGSYVFNATTSQNSVGFTASGGVRCKLGPVNITPEIRYTRWNSNSLTQAVTNFLPLSQNEASVLVGLTF